MTEKKLCETPDSGVMTAKDWLKFIGAESYQGTRVMEDYAAYLSAIKEKVTAWEAWKYGRQLSAEMTTSPAFEAWYEQFKSK